MKQDWEQVLGPGLYYSEGAGDMIAWHGGSQQEATARNCSLSGMMRSSHGYHPCAGGFSAEGDGGEARTRSNMSFRIGETAGID